MSTTTCVIVGASHAGSQLAVSLRQEGFAGRIVLLGEEPWLPYHRPPLSKDFLKGAKTLEHILLRPESAYEKAGVELRLGRRALRIDRAARTLELDDGSTQPWDLLALTVGSRVRRVPISGADCAGVFYLRTVADIEAIRPYVAATQPAVIVGGGYIGLETAAALRGCGMDVTVIEMLPRVLARVTAPELSAFYTRVHAEEGVRILTGTGVAAIEAENGQCSAVIDSAGTRHPARLVIIGAGIVPNIELAEAAGLQVDNGIVVDAQARTSDVAIVAAGDCTRHPNFLYDCDLRLESVQNAHDQAKVAAATLAGRATRYDALPWFWSDQYDLKLQIAGWSAGYDDVVIRGDLHASRRITAFYYRGERLLAVDAVNSPREYMQARRLLGARLELPKALAADAGFDLATIK